MTAHGFDLSYVDHLSLEDRQLLAIALEQLHKHDSTRKFFDLFPDENIILPGREPPDDVIYARRYYQKHLEFFRAGAEFRERMFMAANRVGKTVGGGYEMTAHLTGEYPHWWEGRRFKEPISAWVAGKTNKTTRDIIQSTLLGQVTESGSIKGFDGLGIMPADRFSIMSWNRHFPNLVDIIKVKHKTGGSSYLGFKSYEEGRGSFEGTSKQVIWLDEECPLDIYGECLLRTMTVGGIIMVTFTPLMGLTKMVMEFMPKHVLGQA